MHVSPAKHSYESVTDGRTDRRTNRRRTKWSLCVAMLRRRHKKSTLTLASTLKPIKVHFGSWVTYVMCHNCRPTDSRNQCRQFCPHGETTAVYLLSLCWRRYNILKLPHRCKPRSDFHFRFHLPVASLGQFTSYAILLWTTHKLMWAKHPGLVNQSVRGFNFNLLDLVGNYELRLDNLNMPLSLNTCLWWGTRKIFGWSNG